MTVDTLDEAQRRRSAAQAINMAEGLTTLSSALGVSRETAGAWCLGEAAVPADLWPSVETWARSLGWVE